MYAAIEMGGTKVLIAAGTSPDDLSPPVRLPTTDPQSTIAAIIAELQRLQSLQRPFKGIGIATFGPVGLNPADQTFGHILTTPKKGWTGTDILGPIKQAFPDMPIALDTDVNGAAMGEAHWGAGRGLKNFAYVTVGTGIGVGVVINGQPVHGLLHPEAGHISVKRHPADAYQGGCALHGDCLEGLAAGPSVLARTGMRGEDLPADHPVWSLLGDYLAQLYRSLALITSAERIIVGGGVGLHDTVLSSSRDLLHSGLAGYVEALKERATIDDYIVRAGLGDRAGILGAIALIRRQME
jgi:fructokinase